MLNSEIVNKVSKVSKQDPESLMKLFKDLHPESKLRKGLKQTYKSAVRNHLKLAIIPILRFAK